MAALSEVLLRLDRSRERESVRKRAVEAETWLAENQQPALVYAAGLEAKPWWDADEFELLEELDESFDAIRAEAAALLATDDGAALTALDLRTLAGEGGGVRVLELVDRAAPVAGARAAAPATLEALSKLGSSVSTMTEGHAYLAFVAPGTRTIPVDGPTNVRLRVHLPLVVPAACSADAPCRMTVDAEARRWTERAPLVFDDSHEHYLVNDSDGTVAVLVFDLWHPRLGTMEERNDALRTAFRPHPSTRGDV